MIFALIICFIIFILVWGRKKTQDFAKRLIGKRVCFVIAHPDDESVFFLPTVKKAVDSNCEVFILCLSDGGFRGRGSKRKGELFDAMSVIGIPVDHITVLSDSSFQDSKIHFWDAAHLRPVIKEHLKLNKADVVITFDLAGASAHPNHCATAYACSTLAQQKETSWDCYLLNSYSQFYSFEILLEIAFEPHVVFSPFGFWWSVQCLRKHQTQWHKHIFKYMLLMRLRSVLSNYMYINSFYKVQKLHQD